MTRSDTTPMTAVFAAIDVGKSRSEVLIEMPGSRRRLCLTVANTRVEHDRFVAELQALASGAGQV